MIYMKYDMKKTEVQVGKYLLAKTNPKDYMGWMGIIWYNIGIPNLFNQ